MLPEKFIAASALFTLRIQLPWVIGTTCIAIVLALSPILFEAWRIELATLPSIYYVYEVLSNFKSLASIIFAIASIPLLAAALFGSHAYPGWNIKENNRPALKAILQKKLYPKNLRGMVAFYSFLAIDLLAWLIPFIAICLIAHLIKP